jgi:hypothetical protein
VRWGGESRWRNVLLVEILAVKTKGSGVRLEEKSVADRRRKVINKMGRNCHEIGSEEKECLFIFWFGKMEAVGVHCMEIFEVFELLEGAGNNIWLFCGW